MNEEKNEELKAELRKREDQIEDLEEDLRDLKVELRNREDQIEDLEEGLRESVRNPYVNSNNIFGSTIGGLFLAGFPILILLNSLGFEGGDDFAAGFVGGAVSAGFGAYSYHRSVEKWQKAQQNKFWQYKYWQQRDD